MRHLLLSLALILPFAQAGEIDQSAALRTLVLPDTVLIDVRSADEFASGALPGAQLIPHDQIGARIAAVVPDKNTPVVLYCRSGRRSSQAQDELRALGYTQVMNAGAYEQLKLATTPRDKEAACVDC
ncbi:rhodanese-like domain-containing protein [Aquipseudomonas guryensis]|jgi:phage shock protein E|uniref:Rhodanese-like domain-containing protein n=1 Tax=Aquipseudomonas guryensis TaxID=2759165 RepID=A0A7W4DBK3_9GAMM|nr:rhodanese-like domain-containing protein [Pseudomonas guryensis]MBB1519558.1 rhodanese-like domain-containing protein [Pseudomonas guryensis]